MAKHGRHITPRNTPMQGRIPRHTTAPPGVFTQNIHPNYPLRLSIPETHQNIHTEYPPRICSKSTHQEYPPVLPIASHPSNPEHTTPRIPSTHQECFPHFPTSVSHRTPMLRSNTSQPFSTCSTSMLCSVVSSYFLPLSGNFREATAYGPSAEEGIGALVAPRACTAAILGWY